MVLKHLAGLDRIYELREQFAIELELVCLNSEFDDIKDLLVQAKKLQKQYPQRVVLKESEFHSKRDPYYEISVFCHPEEVASFTQEVAGWGLKVDLIHE